MYPQEKTHTCPFDRLFTINVPHVLEKIFLSLDYESLKNCLKVNAIWNKNLKATLQEKTKCMFSKEILEDELKLWYASSEGNVEEAKRLLSSGMVDVNFVNGHSSRMESTSLGEAALWGHKKVVQLLLDEGAVTNKADGGGRTATQAAVAKGFKDVVELLLPRRADPNETREDGCTLLHMAACMEHAEVVKVLLDGGAEPNKGAEEEGSTPLHFAVFRNCKDSVIFLLDGGADVNKADIYKKTPLYHAAHTALYHEPHHKVNKDVIKLLLDGGADPSNCEMARCRCHLEECLTEARSNANHRIDISSVSYTFVVLLMTAWWR